MHPALSVISTRFLKRIGHLVMTLRENRITPSQRMFALGAGKHDGTGRQGMRLRHDGVMSWASYQIRKIAGCACAGNAGNVFPCRRFQRKPIVSDPGMHHGTCVTHVPWCMSGSLTCGDGENVPGIPGACAPAILRIWQEAHGNVIYNAGIVRGNHLSSVDSPYKGPVIALMF